MWLKKFLLDYHHIDPGLADQIAVSGFWGAMLLGGAVSLVLLKLLDSRHILVAFCTGGAITLLAALYGGKSAALIGLPLMGFWCAVGWPLVFSLALNSVKEHHGSFAGILCTGIVGGAILPPVIGKLGDLFGLRSGLLVLMGTLGYLIFIGLWARPLVNNTPVWRRKTAPLAVLAAVLTLGLGSGCSDSGSSSGPDVCAGVVNQPGTVVDLSWPAASNTGHDAAPGNTVRFHWSGLHNVLQVATFGGQEAPLGMLSDAGWPRELRSGAKLADGSFDWNVGAAPCGYRPGLYYFVDEDSPAGGIVAVSLTDADASHYAPRPCSTLRDASVYGARYAQFADRAGCTLYEVNNFQTEAHYDWVAPILTAKQGDLVLFRWTGSHNVIQVHDVTKDALVSGGIKSGAKTNCVGGPGYSCVNGGPSLGEWVLDTTNYRPGILHISDECALTCTGHTTGMNMEIDLRFPVPHNTPLPPVAGSCCAINKAKGAACRVVEIYNANDGAQLDYNVPVGRGDLVRFRWAGRLKIYQSTPNANGSPSANPKPGGVAMPDFVECTPGPNMSCLEGNTDTAQLVFDVDAEIKRGNAETNPSGQKYFVFHALGDNQPGFTSADSGTLLYVDDSLPATVTACP